MLNKTKSSQKGFSKEDLCDEVYQNQHKKILINELSREVETLRFVLVDSNIAMTNSPLQTSKMFH